MYTTFCYTNKRKKLSDPLSYFLPRSILTVLSLCDYFGVFVCLFKFGVWVFVFCFVVLSFLRQNQCISGWPGTN